MLVVVNKAKVGLVLLLLVELAVDYEEMIELWQQVVMRDSEVHLMKVEILSILEKFCFGDDGGRMGALSVNFSINSRFWTLFRSFSFLTFAFFSFFTKSYLYHLQKVKQNLNCIKKIIKHDLRRKSDHKYSLYFFSLKDKPQIYFQARA